MGDAAQAVSDPHRVGSAEGSTMVCAATAAFPDFHQSGRQMDSMEACHKTARFSYSVVPQPRLVMDGAGYRFGCAQSCRVLSRRSGASILSQAPPMNTPCRSSEDDFVDVDSVAVFV